MRQQLTFIEDNFPDKHPTAAAEVTLRIRGMLVCHWLCANNEH